MKLRKATFSATRWTTTSALIRAVLQVFQIAIFARLLTPADFGLMTTAGVLVAIISLFSDLGLNSALMHFPHPDRRTLSTLYWLNLFLSCSIAILFISLAWPAAQFYEQPELLSILSCLALSFPLSAAGQPFRVLAEKAMQFRTLAQNEVVAATLGFIIGLVVALNGGGVFSLISATLTSASTNSALAWARLSFGITPQLHFCPRQAMPFIRFGLHRVGDGFWNTLRVQTDIFIASIFAPPATLAAYAVPRDQCLKIANTIVNPVITRVGLPVMTQLQHDMILLRSVYLKTLHVTASLNFPIYIAIAIFADEVVALLLGNQWYEAGFYMRLFALWGLIRSTGNPSGSLLYAVGMARRAHIWNMLLFFLTAPLLWLSGKYGGLSGLAWGMLIWQVIVFFLAWRFLILPACGAKFIEYCTSIFRPFLTTSIAAIITIAAIYILPESLKLPLGLCIFGGSYIISSWALNQEWILTLFELLSPLKRFLK